MSTPALPIIYRGWEIWKWTGWKGNKVEIIRGRPGDDCWCCGKPIKAGDSVFREFVSEDRHWTCVYPDNPPQRLVGQWLAVKDRGTTNQRHAVVIVGGPVEGDCEYERGQMFNIGEEALVTELTTRAERDRHVDEGLTRMYALIDRLEDQ